MKKLEISITDEELELLRLAVMNLAKLVDKLTMQRAFREAARKITEEENNA
ncbi:MAG: hypothetical protein IJ309_06315 [Clostridia bacterium]|nr:hypothetical protein [Clostridia bacterium]